MNLDLIDFAQTRVRHNVHRFGTSAVMDADDFTQTALLRIVEDLPRFDPQKGSLGQFIRFRVDAANIDEFRRLGYGPVTVTSLQAPAGDGRNEDIAPGVWDNYETIDQVDQVESVRKAIQELPPVDRLTLCLGICLDGRQHLAAEAYGIRLNTFQVRLVNIRRRLRRQLGR